MSTLVIIVLAAFIIFWRPPFRLNWKLLIAWIILLVVGVLWWNRQIRPQPIPSSRFQSADQVPASFMNGNDF